MISAQDAQRRANWRLGAAPENWETLTTNGKREVEL